MSEMCIKNNFAGVSDTKRFSRANVGISSRRIAALEFHLALPQTLLMFDRTLAVVRLCNKNNSVRTSKNKHSKNYIYIYFILF